MSHTSLSVAHLAWTEKSRTLWASISPIKSIYFFYAKLCISTLHMFMCLHLVQRLIDYSCNACGSQGNRSSYFCFQCNFMIHQNCIDLPCGGFFIQSAYADITNITVVKLAMFLIKIPPAKKTLLVGLIRDFISTKWLEWVLGVGSVVCFWKEIYTIQMDDKFFALVTYIILDFQVYVYPTRFAACPWILNVRLTYEFEWMLVSLWIFTDNKWLWSPGTLHFQLEITHWTTLPDYVTSSTETFMSLGII